MAKLPNHIGLAQLTCDLFLCELKSSVRLFSLASSRLRLFIGGYSLFWQEVCSGCSARAQLTPELVTCELVTCEPVTCDRPAGTWVTHDLIICDAYAAARILHKVLCTWVCCGMLLLDKTLLLDNLLRSHERNFAQENFHS